MQLRRALLALVAAAVLLALPATASAGKKAIWGPLTMPDGSSAFPVYEELGVDVLQMGIVWARVAPTRPARPKDPRDPAYRFPPELDGAIRAARSRDIELLFMVRGSPRWANGNREIRFAPTNDADYANFMTALARRYPGVRMYMVWGETNFDAGGSFSPMPDNSRIGPRRYARLLDKAYVALNRVRKRNIVIGGNTFSAGGVKPAQFVRWMRLPRGKKPRFDWFGHNPFGARFPDIRQDPLAIGYRDICDVDTFSRELRRSFPRKKLWLSEYTVSSDRSTRAFNFYVSRADQAKWLTAAYRIARKRYVAGLGWFNLHDEDPAVRRSLTNGLMTFSGERKPAFFAYKRAR